MANLTESSTWEDNIYQLAITDPVMGGEDGISNIQASQLANRTQYLLTQLATKMDVDGISASDILELLVTVDGADSTLDADLLDGYEASAFVLDADLTAAKVLALIGASDGIDADTLDGLRLRGFPSYRKLYR